jgi:hypothetical protein
MGHCSKETGVWRRQESCVDAKTVVMKQEKVRRGGVLNLIAHLIEEQCILTCQVAVGQMHLEVEVVVLKLAGRTGLRMR